MSDTTLRLGSRSKTSPPDECLNAQALADELLITRRHIDHWTERGYLSAIDDAPGSGYQRLYTPAEAAVAAWISNLRLAGVELPTAASLARNLSGEDLVVLHAILTEGTLR